MKENLLIQISDIKHKDAWFDLRVTCTAVLDFITESIAQKGYVADESGARQYRKEHPESAARVRARQEYIAAQVRRIRLNDDPDSLLNEQNFEEINQ